MFYKYCPFVSRIVPTSQLSAYSPQGLAPYRAESGFIVYDTKSTRPVKQAEPFMEMGNKTGRGMASVAAPTTGAATAKGEVPTNEGYKKIMELQKLMTKDDGLYVWMKRGSRDRIPYYGTMALMGGGLCYCFYMLYQMSMPKKQQSE